MKKLFMKGTDEEIFEGDMIEIECEKEFKKGKLKRDVEFKVTEDSIPYLIEMDIIEEREIEDEEELEDFDSPCDALEGLYDKVGELEEKLDTLMECFNSLKERTDKLEELYALPGRAENKKPGRKK